MSECDEYESSDDSDGDVLMPYRPPEDAGLGGDDFSSNDGGVDGEGTMRGLIGTGAATVFPA